MNKIIIAFSLFCIFTVSSVQANKPTSTGLENIILKAKECKKYKSESRWFGKSYIAMGWLS